MYFKGPDTVTLISHFQESRMLKSTNFLNTIPTIKIAIAKKFRELKRDNGSL